MERRFITVKEGSGINSRFYMKDTVTGKMTGDVGKRESYIRNLMNRRLGFGTRKGRGWYGESRRHSEVKR